VTAFTRVRKSTLERGACGHGERRSGPASSEERLRPERGAGVPNAGPTRGSRAWDPNAAAALGWPAGGKPGEAGPPSESERGWGPASSEERLRPERGAGGKPGEAGPPSESEQGWGPASSEEVLLRVGVGSRAPAKERFGHARLHA